MTSKPRYRCTVCWVLVPEDAERVKDDRAVYCVCSDACRDQARKEGKS